MQEIGIGIKTNSPVLGDQSKLPSKSCGELSKSRQNPRGEQALIVCNGKPQVRQGCPSTTILEGIGKTFEKFNHTRNNQSLAHPGDLLSYDESLYVFKVVSSSIEFIESIESKLISSSVASNGAASTENGPSSSALEDLPF